MNLRNDLEAIGLKGLGKIERNPAVGKLIQTSVERKEGVLGNSGELIAYSGKFTGRSPKDKFIVEARASSHNVWWGEVNQPMRCESFNAIQEKVCAFLEGKDLFVFDGYCGADADYRLNVRILTTKSWHSHFVHNMFIRAPAAEIAEFAPGFTIINACEYVEKDYEALGLRSEVFIIFNLEKKLAIIGGTEYAGEMKKGIFSVMNYLLPLKGVLPMHCSANKDSQGNTALFFGLSGTGKTTLSTSHERSLIGDDEHGWSANGVFNFEGGCYAKVINLSPDGEPEIHKAIRWEAILENVVYDKETLEVDFDDGSITENTRVSYPIGHIPHVSESGRGNHPNCIIFLTCDAFGVLPPVSKLTSEQAAYHFLSGYTAKVAGTELGVTEPTATFSTCFGAPFMTQRPRVYSDLLSNKMMKHGASAYLVNTGWIGGSYGVGHRIDLAATRTIIHNLLDGTLEKSEYEVDPVFGFKFPKTCPGVDPCILNPRCSWENPEEYDKIRKHLASLFVNNFKNFEVDSANLKSAGPKV